MINSTDWTLFISNFIVEYYGIQLIYDRIDRRDADICLSNYQITHFIHWTEKNYFKQVFEAIPDYRKIVLLMFLTKDVVGMLYEFWRLVLLVSVWCLKLFEWRKTKNIWIIKKDESNMEKLLNKWTEQSFPTMF